MEIYDGLMALTEEHEAFYWADTTLYGTVYRVFNYRLGSYSQWILPYALECRGITFERDTKRVVSRPFEKFFNLNENPLTMDLDLSTVECVWDKMDGSLISTMDASDDQGMSFWLKSKGSLLSEQAMAANHLIRTAEYEELCKFCGIMVSTGHTVIMEYTGPSNRIVISYEDHALTVLGVRNNESGDYFHWNTLKEIIPDFLVDDIEYVASHESFIASIPHMVDIEGYVIQLESGQRFKVKTEWYLKLHHIKDSINSQRRLFEAVVYETSDDIKASFFDDPIAIALVEEMEEKVAGIYNHMVAVVEDFYEANKHLERKDYAVKGQQELEKLHFSLAMSKYIGREVDYKATMVKHRKDFGIKDDPEPSEEQEILC